MSLNDTMEFDHVIEVRADGEIIDRNDIYAPETYWSDDVKGNIDFAGDTRWTALNGYSGQDRYSGPVMHSSEFIGGRMETDIIGEPGIYVAVVITDLDDDENPAGWAVLRLDAPEDTSEDACTDHDLDECPDCGNAGVKVGASGYEDCTRFRTCWSDTETGVIT
jgi:hypothetical protein